MANPNILNSTSVKYFNYNKILEKERYTISTSPTSDYQTKNIVLRNDVNSGKILKINRIYFSNQCISTRNANSRSLYLTYITDYTDSTIADTALGNNGTTFLPRFGETRIEVTRNSPSVTYLYNNPIMVMAQIFPSETSTSFFYNWDSFYLMEGNAIECWASTSYSSQDLAYAEFYTGRARIHIEYEEYTE